MNRPRPADGVRDELERDGLADAQAVERCVVTQIGAMEEDLAPVSQTDEAIRLSDDDSNDRAAGACTG
jgi:hypothetical protein